MKVKAMYGVSILVVFALAAIGFSMIPGSVSGAGESGLAEPFAKPKGAAASPTDTNTTDTGTEGTENTYYGDGAGNGNTGRWVTFIGAEAGASSNSGGSNTFVGQRCGWQNTSGDSNTFVGKNAGALNTEGNSNTFMGRAAGYANTTGDQNTFVGDYAGYANTTGSCNTIIGHYAGYENTEGYFNTFVGLYAGYNNTTDAEHHSGALNTFTGYRAGFSNTIGVHNVCIGDSAGHDNEIGNRNIFLGHKAGFYETGSNRLYIDTSFTPTDTPLIYGEFDTKKIQINGSFRAVATSTSSDRRWKKNIKPLESSLDKISGLQGVSYEWNRDEYPDVGMMKGKQIGLVAQDVEQVLPELVSEDKDGYKAVSYTKLTAVLVEAVKELKAENQKQQTEIEELRSIIKELKS